MRGEHEKGRDFALEQLEKRNANVNSIRRAEIPCLLILDWNSCRNILFPPSATALLATMQPYTTIRLLGWCWKIVIGRETGNLPLV